MKWWFPFGGYIALRLYWLIYQNLIPEGDRKVYKKLKKHLDTPARVQAWLYWNVKYTPDTPVKDEDEWQDPEITFRRKKGDCEDWVRVGNDCLGDKYNCTVLCMYKKGEGHATLLIDKDLSIGTFGYKRHKGKIKDILKDWSYEDWTKYTTSKGYGKKVTTVKRK